jgi:hypothetical protein
MDTLFDASDIFNNDFESWKKFVLPVLEKKNNLEGKLPLSEEEIMNLFLEQYPKNKSK